MTSRGAWRLGDFGRDNHAAAGEARTSRRGAVLFQVAPNLRPASWRDANSILLM